MNGTCCDGKGGWTRVAYLNMTESGDSCPPGLNLLQYNNIDHGLCGRLAQEKLVKWLLRLKG